MSTVTESTFAQTREEHDQRMFEAMAAHFFKKWAPHDMRERAEFNGEFYGLVRRIYMDAQAPVFKQLEKVMACMPMIPNLVVPTQGDSK